MTKETYCNNYQSMKAYTDLVQSKKLAEILPIESADMCYRIVAYNLSDAHVYQPYCFVGTLESDIPCWSLAALIGVLPNKLQIALAINDFQGDIKERYAIGSVNSDIYDCYADNPVDACYEMIIKLKENNLL